MLEGFFKEIKTDTEFFIEAAKKVRDWNAKAYLNGEAVHGKFENEQFLSQIACLREELKEYQEACNGNDHVEVLDAAGDIFVVASYLAYMFFGEKQVEEMLNLPVGDYLSDKIYDNFITFEDKMTDPAQMAYMSLTITHYARNTLVRSLYNGKGVMKEILKSNDSKYPSKKQLLKIWDTKDISEALEKECRAIEERSANRKEGAYTGVTSQYNEEYKVYVFRDSNNKIMKPSTFVAPDLSKFVKKGS